MAKSPYTSRKLLNELKKLEKESGDMMLTHNLHDIAINGKKVGCSGHITNIFNKRCVYRECRNTPCFSYGDIRHNIIELLLKW